MIGHEGGVYPSNFIIPHLKSGRVCAGMSVRNPVLLNKKWQGLPRNRWQGLDQNRGRVYVGILTRVWVDETYTEYCGKDQSIEKFAVRSQNIIVCKSMSKVYALSGLRAAYLCASPFQLEKLRSLSPPWAVSLPSQIAAVMALKEPAYYEACYAQTHILREAFSKQLRTISSMDILQSKANFILCFLPENGPDAATVVAKCREFGLYLRDVSNMGRNFNKRTIRIAIKDEITNNKMIEIIQKVLQ